MAIINHQDIVNTLYSLRDGGFSLFSSSSVRDFEEKLSEVLNCQYAISVSLGTAALHIALMACNIKGEVLVPAFTHPSSVLPIVYLECEPVFVNMAGIDPSTSLVKLGRKLAHQLKKSDWVQFKKGAFENIPFPGRVFQVVMSNASFNLTLEKNKAPSEMSRVVKDNGKRLSLLIHSKKLMAKLKSSILLAAVGFGQ